VAAPAVVLSGRLVALAVSPCRPPIAGQGYSLVFADDFAAVDSTVCRERQWWEDPPQAGSPTIVNGTELRLRRTRTGNDYQNTTMSSEPCGQANPKSFRQGYFESRMKWTGAQGAGPPFWMFSTAHAENGDGVPGQVAEPGVPGANLSVGGDRRVRGVREIP
jgi:hypothetical protein